MEDRTMTTQAGPFTTTASPMNAVYTVKGTEPNPVDNWHDLHSLQLSGTTVKERLCKELDTNIPRECVSERGKQRGSSETLSYLKTWYVIDRMNKVFGNLSWNSETMVLNQVAADKPTYYAKVRVLVTLPNGQIVFHDGIGYGSDKGTQNPHEMAVKEAESDAFKRAAMKFGISMGLGLYTGDNDFITETEVETPVASAPKTADTSMTTEEFHAKIQSLAKVAIAKKKFTKEALSDMIKKEYSVEKVKELNPTQSLHFYNFLREMTRA